MKADKESNEYIQAAIACNLALCLFDVCETGIMDMNEKCKKAGIQIKYDAKFNIEKALRAIKEIRKFAILVKDIDTQNNFAKDSDCIFEFVRLLVDRTGVEKDNQIMKMIYFTIKNNFKSIEGMDLDTDVFND